jgi:hypothetical protein
MGDMMEGVPFREMLLACEEDAAAQEHIVGVVADLLDWQCASNDEELVSSRKHRHWGRLCRGALEIASRIPLRTLGLLSRYR